MSLAGAEVADQGIRLPSEQVLTGFGWILVHGLIYVVIHSHIIRGQAETNPVYIIQGRWRSVILAKLKTTVLKQPLSLACRLL